MLPLVECTSPVSEISEDGLLRCREYGCEEEHGGHGEEQRHRDHHRGGGGVREVGPTPEKGERPQQTCGGGYVTNCVNLC